MATTDLERLIVSLEASTVKYERALNKAQGVTNTRMRKIESRTAAMGKNVSAAMGRAFLLVGGIGALRGAQNLIDASTRIENSLKVAGLAGDELTKVYDRLFASAQRNAAPLEALTELYGRAALVQKELGVSTEELLGFTDNIAVALRVSGKSAAESSGALLQLSQALGSGIVRAEEFNSILEGALPVAQAAAAGLEEAGGSVAKLRQLVVDGKVSSEAFFRAFEAGSVILTEKVAGAELTISQGFVRLQNVLIDTAGKFDKATNASADFARFLNDLGEGIERVTENERLGWLLKTLNDFGNAQLGGTARELEAIGNAINFIDGMINPAAASADELEASIRGVITAASGVADTEAIDGLIERLADGEIGAQELQQELIALGGTSINFAAVNDLAGLIGQLRTARAEAQALAVDIARPRGPQGRGGRRGSSGDGNSPTVETVSLEDYDAPTKPGKGTSPAEKAAKEIEKQRQAVRDLIADLEFENSLIGRSEIEQAKMTAIRQAGAAATLEQQTRIGELVEANIVEQRQVEALQELYSELGNIGQSAVRGIIDAMADGKIEAEEFGDILSNVLGMAGQFFLNQAFGSFGGTGGGNVLGSLFGGARANGGPVSAGKAYLVGERGPEIMIPRASGAVVPNHAMGGTPSISISVDARGAERGVGPEIAREVRKVLPSAIEAYNRNPYRRT